MVTLATSKFSQSALVIFTSITIALATAHAVHAKTDATIANAIADANTLIEDGHPDKAVAALSTAIAAHPTARAHAIRGRAYSYMGKSARNNAYYDFSKAIELDRKEYLAYLYRG
ncbi:MAG: hypothetical protein ACRD3W_16135, partial [Terriglobales bacterium]